MEENLEPEIPFGCDSIRNMLSDNASSFEKKLKEKFSNLSPSDILNKIKEECGPELAGKVESKLKSKEKSKEIGIGL